MRLLLVEDYEPDAALTIERLRRDPEREYEVEHCRCLEEAIGASSRCEFEAALLDLTLPDGNGLETFLEFSEAYPDLPTVVLTGLTDARIAKLAVERGAQDFLVKDELSTSILGRSLQNAVTRKKAEQRLRAVQQRLRSLLQHSRDPSLLVNAQGVILYANRGAVDLVGFPLDEYVGEDVFGLIDPKELSARGDFYQKVLAEPGTIHRDVIRIEVEGGSARHIELSVDNRLADPEVEALVVNLRDKTEQVEAQEALAESEQRYRMLFENSLDGVAHAAPDGRIFEMNRALREMLGFSAEEIAAGQVHRRDVADRSDPRLAAALAQRSRTGRFRGELNFRRRDGTVFPAEITTNLYLDAKGNERTSMIVRDVSDRKRIERKLQDYQEQLAHTEQVSLVMSTYTSLDGRWLKVPARLCELLGYGEEELLSMTYQEVSHPDDLAKDDELTRRLLDGELPSIELEKRFLRKDGSPLWAYINVTVVRDKEGEPLHFLTYIRDVTAERDSEEQALRHYKLLLERITGLAERVAISKDHDEVYRALFDFACEDTPTHSLAVSHLDDEEGLRRLVFAGGSESGEFEQGDVSGLPPLPVTDSAGSRAMRERRVIVANDVERSCLGRERDLGEDSRGSAVAIPMVVLGTVVGVFEFGSDFTDAFRPEHVAQLQMAANLAAVATDNLRLLQKQTTARKQAEAERARLQSVLEQSPALIATAEGPEMVFTSANERYKNFFSGKEILGKRVADVLPEIEAQGILDILQRVYETGESFAASELPMELDTEGDGKLTKYYFNLVYQALRDPDEKIVGVLANAFDVSEQVKARKELESLHANLQRAYDSTIAGWARALDLKDEDTAGHSQRVTELAVRLGRRLGMGEEDLVHLRRGALLHDIGKMGVPDSVLLKAGKLDETEWSVMKRHTIYGRDFLYPIEHLRKASEIPYCHHEHWDGSGYPRGLRGEEIPLAARIFSVVDVFDALTNERPYRPAWSREEALEYLARQRGKQFDPDIVDELFELLSAATVN